MSKEPEWEAAGFKSPDEFRRGEDAFRVVVILGAVCVIVVLAMWGGSVRNRDPQITQMLEHGPLHWQPCGPGQDG
jgi:hypothetical protein